MKRIGTEIELDDDGRSKLISDLRYWHTIVADPNSSIALRRNFERAFYCIWDGQNAQGVRKDEIGKKAWPFEGASDQRIRWGEKIFLDLMAYTLVAISSCEVEITCAGDPDGAEKSRALKQLLLGVEASLGAKGLAEIKAMFHYMFVDTPAVGALDVSWKKHKTIGVVTLDIDELEEEFATFVESAGGARSKAAIAFRNVINDMTSDLTEHETVRAWMIAHKKLLKTDLGKIYRALAEDGECECRAIVDYAEGPELRALRYGEDFCIPTVTNDFDYASPWFRSEWMTETQLRERVSDEGWDETWAEETLTHKGFDLFNEWATAALDEMKDLVNVVWAYQTETNDRGETTRWVSVLSMAEGSAFGKRILKNRRGKWDTAFFRREVRNSNILDGRGLAELCSPAQGTAKIIRDGSANNAIVGSLPPIKAKGARARNFFFEPFRVVQLGASDDISFMQPPAFPAAASKEEEKIKAELYDYFGIPHDGQDPIEKRMELTAWIIKQWRDFLVLLLETAQDNASEGFISRVTASGDAKSVKSADVSGQFLITLKLDPRNLDNAKLIEKVQAAAQVLQSMDRTGEVDTAPFVRHFFTMLFPEMASTALKTSAQLQQDDIKAEEQNFVLIKAGIMPPMDTTGKWNYKARLDFYANLQQTNPSALQDMSPASQEMLFNQWIPALEQQNTQFGANAAIGKTGVEGVGAGAQ